jgi:hypothetical protein
MNVCQDLGEFGRIYMDFKDLSGFARMCVDLYGCVRIVQFAKVQKDL